MVFGVMGRSSYSSNDKLFFQSGFCPVEVLMVIGRQGRRAPQRDVSCYDNMVVAAAFCIGFLFGFIGLSSDCMAI